MWTDYFEIFQLVNISVKQNSLNQILGLALDVATFDQH